MEQSKASVSGGRPAPTDGIPPLALALFLLVTFGISWGIMCGYIFFPQPMTAVFGAIEGAHPLYFLATWGPGIAGIFVVIRYGGWKGLRAFLSRLLIWRVGGVWWLLILLVLPLIFMVGSAIKGGPLLAPMENGAGELLVLSVIMLFLGPIEEFGWRGVAQPLLQRHIAPFWTGALIGAVWGVWHFPAFFLSGTVYADWNFPLFLTGTVTMGILASAMFNKTQGSLLLPMLFHWQLIIPFWPDAQPWDTWILVAVTALVVWRLRDLMFTRGSGVTTVIPAPHRSG